MPLGHAFESLSLEVVQIYATLSKAGLSSLGVPGVPWHTQYLADQLTLFQPGGTNYAHQITTVNSRFKKDLNLQIHLHKAFFSDDQFLDSYHKSFLNQTTLDLRKKKWGFLNQDLPVHYNAKKKKF